VPVRSQAARPVTRGLDTVSVPLRHEEIQLEARSSRGAAFAIAPKDLAKHENPWE
jgi:hypothetical protein